MKLLFILMAALMLPIVPALACFPQQETDEILFQSEDEGAHGGRNFDRNPLPMSFCELPEPGFVVVNGKCYDFDAITDFDTEEECQADEVCKAYREQQKQEQEQEHYKCPADGGADCTELKSIEEQNQDLERTDDPNHGEIKGDEELEQDEDREEHQEEEEQGQAQGESEQTTSETDE